MTRQWPYGGTRAPFGVGANASAVDVSRFLKAELKRADVTYEELARRLKKHGLPNETQDSIKSKLKRGTFAATFLLACLAALELEGIQLDDL